MTPRRRLPRTLHPVAWWAWALGLAVASTATTNPLVLLLIIGVLSVVVAARGRADEGLLGFRLYLVLAAIVLLVRILFRIVLGTGVGSTVLFTLPELPLPNIVAGIRIGGPVTAEGLVAAFSDGLRLATLIVCVGAANSLADPRRLLRATPAALHDVATAVVLALSIAPQLVVAFARVRRARRLRGTPANRLRDLRQLLIPVLEEGLDRSLSLAAAMDSRGFGRAADGRVDLRWRAHVAALAGVGAICIGTYGLLDATTPILLGWPALLLGTALAVLGVRLAGHGSNRTTYRPDTWHGAEVAVIAAGVAAGAVVLLAARWQPDALHPSTNPLTWPTLPLLAVVAVLAAGAVAVATPPLRLAAATPPLRLAAATPPLRLAASRRALERSAAGAATDDDRTPARLRPSRAPQSERAARPRVPVHETTAGVLRS